MVIFSPVHWKRTSCKKEGFLGQEVEMVFLLGVSVSSCLGMMLLAGYHM